MRITLFALLLFPLLLVAATGALGAQGYTGDFIMSGWFDIAPPSPFPNQASGDGVFRVNRTTRRITTLAHDLYPLASLPPASRVMMAENNRDLFVLAGWSNIHRLDPSGRMLATIRARGAFGNVTDMILDQNGRLLIMEAGLNRLRFVAIDPASQTITTLATLPGGAEFSQGGALAKDPHTGDLLVASWANLFRLDRATFRMTTLAGGWLGYIRPRSLVPDPRTGIVYAGCHQLPAVAGLDLARSKVHVLDNWRHGAFGLAADRRASASGIVLYGTDGAYAQGMSLFRIDATDANPTGTLHVLEAWASIGPDPMPWSLTIEGSREVQPVLFRAPNERTIRLSFPGHGGKRYVCAIGASGVRPGVPLGDGRMIHLAVDPIVTASLSGALDAFLPGRAGTLFQDGSGRAGLALNALGQAARGLSVTFQALVLDPRAPRGIAVIAEPYTIRLE